MTTYKGIKGLSLQTIAGDPSNLALGDIWYDSVAKKVQGAKLPAGAWSTANDVNTRKDKGGSSGTASAAVAFLGTAGPFLANSEEYDGTSWAEGSNINTARSRPTQNIGTQTAGLCAGGRASGNEALTEEYNGTSWSESGDLPTGVERGGGAGTQTAGLSFGGRAGAGTTSAVEAYEYDGTSWADGGDLAVAKHNPFGFGTQTAAVGAGGYIGPGVFAESFTYDGTSFTETANINTTRKYGANGGDSASLGFIAGGSIADDTAQVHTEEWDGSSWTEVANLNTAQHFNTGCGTNASALAIGGLPGGVKVESWDHNIAAVTFTSS